MLPKHSENQDVILFPIQVHGPLNSICCSLGVHGPRVKNSGCMWPFMLAVSLFHMPFAFLHRPVFCDLNFNFKRLCSIKWTHCKVVTQPLVLDFQVCEQLEAVGNHTGVISGGPGVAPDRCPASPNTAAAGFPQLLRVLWGVLLFYLLLT